MSIPAFAADLADRIPALAMDCKVNNEEVIKNLLMAEFSPAMEKVERDQMISHLKDCMEALDLVLVWHAKPMEDGGDIFDFEDEALPKVEKCYEKLCQLNLP